MTSRHHSLSTERSLSPRQARRSRGLLTQLRSAAARDRHFEWYARVLAFLLAGYLLFDRAFAWIHIPGTPIFIGEVVLIAGLVIAVPSRSFLRLLRLSAPIRVLLLYMGWGMILAAFGVGSYAIDAVRDSALWYYGLFALVVGTMVLAKPELLDYLIDSFAKFIPILLVVMLPRALLAQSEVPIFMPDSEVSITSHKPGNLTVNAALVVAFLVLVVIPNVERARVAWFRFWAIFGVVVAAAAGSQSRGGSVAAALILIILFMMNRRARPIMAAALIVLVGLGTVMYAVDFKIDLARRELSVRQIVDNFSGLADWRAAQEAETFGAADNDEQAETGTIKWRLELWGRVYDDLATPERALAGFGFGENLAERYGFVDPEGPPLRNPHNSHLSVFARMGAVGVLLWVAVWFFFFRHTARARKALTFGGNDRWAGLASWSMLGAFGIIFNAFFDPTFEGPQVGAWMWTIFGIGAALAILSFAPRRSRFSFRQRRAAAEL